MKKCPFCAEEIQDEAIKCKHCMEFLNGSKPSTPPTLQTAAQTVTPWYFRTGFIAVTFLTFPPLALPLVWLRPGLHIAWKVAITAFAAAFCWFSYLVIQNFLRQFDEATRMLNEFRI